MPTVSVSIVGPSYADETIAFGVEDTVNFIPEASGSIGTRDKYILRTHAGLTAWKTDLSGPVRGVREMGGVFYAVAGEVLYSIDSGSVATNLGTILGGGRCIMSDLFIPATKRQLIIMTGERGYVYDTLTGLAEITDDDFVSWTTFDTVTSVDSYAIVETEDGFIYSASTNALAWAALDFATAESCPDRVKAVWSVYGDLWVFGEKTIEVFRTTGSTTDVFQRIQTIEKGCGSAYSMANLDNAVFWLDDSGRVYRASGMDPTRVSTHAVEQYLQSVDYSQAFGFTFVDRGHEFYGLTVPGGKTFLYDVATGLWHRRKSEHVDRWRISAHAKCYGLNLFGDYATGTIWKLDESAVVEGSDRLIRERISGVLQNNGQPLFVSRLEIIADTGNAEQTGDPEETDPVIEMCYSKDGGRVWGNWKQASIGAIGQYGKRLHWHRLGRTRQRAFHVRISDPVRCDLIAATLDIEPGA